jgi:hypothetical protein
MTHRAGAAVLARALGLVVLVALGGCLSHRRTERRGPFLSIVRQEGGTVQRSLVPSGSIALAFGGLPPEELTRLRELLEESTEAAVRRAGAMLFDLELTEDDATPVADPLRRALPDLPALTAAANVLGAPWSAPGLSVKLGPACDAAASRCTPLFAPATHRDDTLVRRGRALAWTLGNAALLRVPRGSRTALLRSLRGAQARPSSTIALVFGAPRGALDEAELERLREQAGRALAHLAADAPQRSWLEALGAAPAGWELPLTFDPDEVLVIPRLSALARLQDFHSEIDLAGTFE